MSSDHILSRLFSLQRQFTYSVSPEELSMIISQIILSLLLGSCSAFLLDSNVSSTNAFTTHTSQQLFDLLLEEKQLRHQLENYVAVLEQKINKNQADLQKLSAQAAPQSRQSAFTVWHPLDGLLAKTLRFSTVVASTGNDYATATGKFTCSLPGNYFFSLSLYKKRTITRVYDAIGCFIRKNGINVIQAYLDPTDDDTDKGGYETSQFLTVNLMVGDVIDIGGCNYNSTALGTYSSFSGFLFHAM